MKAHPIDWTDVKTRIPRPRWVARAMAVGLVAQLGLIWMTGLLAHSASPMPENLDDYPQVKLSHPVSRTLQKVTGITLVTRVVASTVANKVLAREVGGQLKLSIRPYSAGDLLSGKAHGLRLRGKNLLFDDVLPISRLEAETDEGYNVFVRRSKKPVLLHPVQARVVAEMSEADLTRFVASETMQGWLTNIKVPLPPFGAQRLDCLNPEVSLEEDGRIRLKTLANIHGADEANAVPVEAFARLVVTEDGGKGAHLALGDVTLNVEGLENTPPIAAFMEDYFGSLFDSLLGTTVDGHKLKVQVRQVEVKDDVLKVHALVDVRPSEKLLQKLAAESAK